MTLPPPPRKTPGLYEQEDAGLDALVYVHYFVWGCDWFVTEYDPESGDCFGWVRIGGEQELGYFNYQELCTVRVNGLFPVDVDDDWRPRPLSEVRAMLTVER